MAGNFTNNTNNNTTKNVSELKIDDDRLVLYAIGELTADEMADIDEYAFTHPETNAKLEGLLEIVDLIESSPELQQALEDPGVLAEFLIFLASFGNKLWPWRQKNGKKTSLLAAIKQKFQEWTRNVEPEPEDGLDEFGFSYEAKRTGRSFGLGRALFSLRSPVLHDVCCCCSMPSSFEPPVPQFIPNALDGFTAEKKNVFLTVTDNPFSTFGLDVDTASYTLAKQYIKKRNQLPPPESVREEEYINFFDWCLPKPEKDSVCPFKPTVEIGPHPLKPNLLLAKIGIQGKTQSRENVPAINLTYLIDVSGSMGAENKLELIKKSLCNQVDFLREEDSISIVTYSDTAKVLLSSTPVKNRKEIKSVIHSLYADGCTNASDGLVLAYRENKKRFDSKGVNRVILCSDGDFNVGVTDRDELKSLIKQQAQSGVFLTVLGFGMGNYKDNTMETLANYGQGSYHYINSKKEAKRILEDENFGSMLAIAKDVKIQIDFNPARVQSYRLIGYENRVMEAQDFNNDKKESGAIGAGQNVLALYEIVPVGVVNELEPSVDKSRYEKFHQTEQKAEQGEEQTTASFDPLSNELFLVKIRWKEPDADASQYQDFPVGDPTAEEKANVSPDFRFAYAVALFAQILANGNYTCNAKFDDVLKLIPENRTEQQEKFVKLVEKAKKINS
ncbi:MAG: von Willebrand factor type A domain-containing protein [Thermoguttaceae bacterium]|nr:von Willebrand factor type A domain-containing protein [Thermoguttaceae bacterium]